ncbi:MAG: type II toxin-antitoxin system VapC family toxin [Anaerolineae bacterium]|nr:type II toxin-antitoxin system VapC family toxin [Anaerolineae bacterium]
MANYLLDTNHLSPLVTQEHPLRKRVLERLAQDDTFAVPVPALAEFLFGISMAPRARQNMEEWERLKPDFGYHDATVPDAEQAANLQVLLRRRGWQLGTVYALIATVALRNNLVLLTTDRDFAAFPGLSTENWR